MSLYGQKKGKTLPCLKKKGDGKDVEQLAQKVFLISDTHFSHANIIRYENRPFATPEEMDAYMIEQWNRVVAEEDLVFHLGDVGIFRAKQAERILPQLSGRKILILGNHDVFTKSKWRRLGFAPYTAYEYEGYLLTHKPMDEAPLRTAVAEGMLKGNVHGHTHSKNQHLDKALYKCCCVEFLAYRPMEFEAFVAIGSD